jgi:hypothetical protein
MSLKLVQYGSSNIMLIASNMQDRSLEDHVELHRYFLGLRFLMAMKVLIIFIHFIPIVTPNE